jgi:hypothetical protein
MTTIDLLNSTAPVRAFHLTTHLKSGYSVALLEQGLAHKTIKGWAWILHDRDETTDNLHCVFWCERDPGLETLSRWFSLPSTQFDRIKRGKEGIAACVKYLLHDDEDSQAAGKARYQPSDLHAVPGWDWQEFLHEMALKEALSGTSRQKSRGLVQQVASGEISVREALRRGARSESQLRRLRAMYLAQQDPTAQRIAFYVYGEDYYAVQTLSRGLAETLAEERSNVFEFTSTFDLYDGEPVTHATIDNPLSVLDSFGNDQECVRAFVALSPSRVPIATKYGPSQLLHKYVVICGRWLPEHFQAMLAKVIAGEPNNPYSPHLHGSFVESYLPIILAVNADELAVQVNQGVLGEGTFTQYRSLGTFRMNLRNVIEQSRGLSEDERFAIESAAMRQNLAPALEARQAIIDATTVASSDGESARAEIEQLLEEAGQRIAD